MARPWPRATGPARGAGLRGRRVAAPLRRIEHQQWLRQPQRLAGIRPADRIGVEEGIQRPAPGLVGQHGAVGTRQRVGRRLAGEQPASAPRPPGAAAPGSRRLRARAGDRAVSRRGHACRASTSESNNTSAASNSAAMRACSTLTSADESCAATPQRRVGATLGDESGDLPDEPRRQQVAPVLAPAGHSGERFAEVDGARRGVEGDEVRRSLARSSKPRISGSASIWSVSCAACSGGKKRHIAPWCG